MKQLLILSLLGGSLLASPIAKENGFSGHIAAGITSLNLKSNMLAGTSFDDEMTENRISSIQDEVDSKTTFGANVNFNLKYTFAEAQTEVFIGRELYDVLSFDDSAVLGVRTVVPGFAIVGIGGLISSIPTKVWKDPYSTGSTREATNSTSRGIALKIEHIFNSNLEVELRTRKFSVDSEDSALSNSINGAYPSGLSPLELNTQLNRNGDLNQVLLSYTWIVKENQFLKSSLRYSDYDLDGTAMEHTKVGLKVDYIYVGKKWNFIGVLNIAEDSFANINPLFNEKADANIYGASLSVMYKDPFGLSKDLSLTTTAAMYEHDSDITFYNSSASLLNISAVYSF